MVRIDYLVDAAAPANSKATLPLKEKLGLSTYPIINWEIETFWTNFHRIALGTVTFCLLIYAKTHRAESFDNLTYPM
jgi:hypothetical protein